MNVPAHVFDANVERWLAEQAQPWMQIKHMLTMGHLQQHMPSGALHILDAGGGSGTEALPLAAAGHSVTIVDYSQAMLDHASAQAQAAGLSARITTQLAALDALPALFAQPAFDVVLCHNVLQYVADVPALLRALAAPLKPGGLLSLISANRYAMPYRAAFMQGDLAAAQAKLDERSEQVFMFPATVTEYSAEEIGALLAQAGCRHIADYGIRCITDYWGSNEQKRDPATFAKLVALEQAMAARHPYKLLARYFHLLALKPTS